MVIGCPGESGVQLIVVDITVLFEYVFQDEVAAAPHEDDAAAPKELDAAAAVNVLVTAAVGPDDVGRTARDEELNSVLVLKVDAVADHSEVVEVRASLLQLWGKEAVTLRNSELKGTVSLELEAEPKPELEVEPKLELVSAVCVAAGVPGGAVEVGDADRDPLDVV
jgi:hypothetical protein